MRWASVGAFLFCGGCLLDFDGLAGPNGGSGGNGATGGNGGDAGSTSTAGGSEGGAPLTGGGGATIDECGAGNRCVPEGIDGFDGPSLVVSGDATSCPGGLGISGGVPSASIPSCECDYSGPTPCTIPEVQYFSDNACSTFLDAKASPLAICGPLGLVANSLDGSPSVEDHTGACVAGPAPSPAYDTPLAICQNLALGESCDGGTCAALPPGGRICVWRELDLVQPGCVEASPFTEQIDFSRTELDCASACGDPAVNCSGNTVVYPSQDCSGGGFVVTHGAAPFCQGVSGVASGEFNPTSAAEFAGECSDEVAVATSKVFTVCCLPP